MERTDVGQDSLHGRTGHGKSEFIVQERVFCLVLIA